MKRLFVTLCILSLCSISYADDLAARFPSLTPMSVATPSSMHSYATPKGHTHPVATASATGFMPILSGAATDFLNGTGAFSPPIAAAGPHVHPYYDPANHQHAQYVPYTGATGNVDLGANNLTANSLYVKTGAGFSTYFATSAAQTGFIGYVLPLTQTDGLLRNTMGNWSWDNTGYALVSHQHPQYSSVNHQHPQYYTSLDSPYFSQVYFQNGAGKYVDLQPSAAMTSFIGMTLPATIPPVGQTYIMNMNSSGTMGFDSNSYTAAGHTHSAYIPYTDTTTHITVVPLAGDINTYIAAASVGDTLMLSAGTYTITDDIAVNKQLSIVGQGEDATTILLATANKNAFNITASLVDIKDLTVNVTATGCNAFKFNGTGGAVITGNVLDNIVISIINVNNTADDSSAVYVADSDTFMKHLRIYGSYNGGGAGSLYGIHVIASATTDTSYNVNLRNSTLNMSANTSGNIEGVRVEDTGSSKVANFFSNSSIYVVSGSTSTNIYGIHATGAEAYVAMYYDNIDGATSALKQDTGSTVYAIGSSIHPTTVIGTVSFYGTILTDSLYAKSNVIATNLYGSLYGNTHPQYAAVSHAHSQYVPYTGASSTIAVNNQDISQIKTATFNGMINNGTVGSSMAIDWTAGNRQHFLCAATSKNVFTFTAPSGPTSVTLIGTCLSVHPVTWPANVLWPSKTHPTWSTGTDVICFTYTGQAYIGTAATDVR